MKKIFFKKLMNPKEKTKTVFISSQTEDKECKTNMRKNFEYKVSRADKVDLNLEAPQVHIRKSFDTKKRIEKFCLRVDGKFYMKHERVTLKVDFCHALNIEIRWKTKAFSPKKSEILT